MSDKDFDVWQAEQKPMTDNEIIEALECCKKDDCDNCPNNFGNCYANLAGYATDLINRQKAEIESIVHCADCQYSETVTDPIADIEFRVCQWYPYTHRVKDTHYCGYGIRKGDNNV